MKAEIADRNRLKELDAIRQELEERWDEVISRMDERIRKIYERCEQTDRLTKEGRHRSGQPADPEARLFED